MDECKPLPVAIALARRRCHPVHAGVLRPPPHRAHAPAAGRVVLGGLDNGGSGGGGGGGGSGGGGGGGDGCGGGSGGGSDAAAARARAQNIDGDDDDDTAAADDDDDADPARALTKTKKTFSSMYRGVRQRQWGTWAAEIREGVTARGARLWQGLTLVHLAAQRKLFLCDRGCSCGLLRGCLGGVRGC